MILDLTIKFRSLLHTRQIKTEKVSPTIFYLGLPGLEERVRVSIFKIIFVRPYWPTHCGVKCEIKVER